jgi:hypothetical protein
MAHESNLPDGVSFGEPPNLSFSDHVHRFVALNGVQCAIDRPEPETGRDSFLNEAVILLDDVVQIRCRAAAAIAPQLTGSLQVRNHLWVRRMSIHVDHPRPDLASPRERQSKEVLGGNRIALGREHELDRLSRGIDRSVQVGPDSSGAY